MARILYVEFDDEITELVERIRTSGEDRDLVVVLPNRARVLQSPLNLRLLQQYSRSFMKNTAIVSGDPRVQQLARDAAFPVFASVNAYERGVEALPPLEDRDGRGGGGAPPMGGAPPIGGLAAFPTGDRRPGATASGGTAPIAGVAIAQLAPPPAAAPRVRQLLPSEPADRPVLALAPPVAGAVKREQERRRRRLYIIAGAVFLIGLLLLFVVAPSAKVTIVLAAKPVSIDGMVIQGTPDPVAAQGAGKIRTEVVQEDVPSTLTAKPTGQKQIAAAAATAQIQFATRYPSPFCLAIGKNTVLAASGAVKWVSAAQPTSTCVANGGGGVLVPGSSSGDFGTPSQPIQVVAAGTGVAGNVAAGQINTVDPSANGCNPANYPPPSPINPAQPPSCDPQTDFKVFNPAAAAGGVDAKTLTVANDQDVAGFKTQVTQLTQAAEAKAKAELPGKAQRPGQTYAIDPAGNGLAFTVDVTPPLPAPGDPYNQTTVTVTVHASGVLYSPDDLSQQVQKALAQKVTEQSPNGTLLGSGVIIKPAQVQQSGGDGRVVFNEAGSGYISPAVDPQQLKDGFSGKSRSTVRDVINQRFGSAVQDVQFSQAIPWFTLPYFSSRIEVRVCVHSPTETCG